MAVYREFVCIVGGPLGLMPQNYFAQAGAKGSEVPKQAAQGLGAPGLGTRWAPAPRSMLTNLLPLSPAGPAPLKARAL